MKGRNTGNSVDAASDRGSGYDMQLGIVGDRGSRYNVQLGPVGDKGSGYVQLGPALRILNKLATYCANLALTGVLVSNNNAS